MQLMPTRSQARGLPVLELAPTPLRRSPPPPHRSMVYVPRPPIERTVK